MPRAEGPFRIIGQLNDNAYKVDLLGDYGVFATFDVANLSPYLDDNYLENLRPNSSSRGENDVGQSLLASTSPNKSKSKLMHFIFQALKTHMDRAHHDQVVAHNTAILHPECKAYKQPSFGLLVS